MEPFDDSKKVVSVYNEAQFQIERLNDIWVKCHGYAKKGKLLLYKWELDRAWVELSTDAKKINKEYYFQGIDKLNSAIARANNQESLYLLLQKKEIFLRNLQDVAGKGSKRRKEGGTWF